MIQSYLGKLQAKAIDTERIKRDGWHEDGILVVSINDPRLCWTDRQTVKNLAETLYGKRNAR